MRYFQQSVQSSRCAYDQLIAAQCPVNDSLLIIKAAKLLLARIGTVSPPPTCAAVRLHCGGITVTAQMSVCTAEGSPAETAKHSRNSAVCNCCTGDTAAGPPSLPLPHRAKRGSSADYVTSGPSAAQTQQRQLLSHSR